MWPALRSVMANSRISVNASRKGARSVIWLPMCMWMPDHGDARQLGGARIEGGRRVEGNAELVLGLAGRDLLVRLGIDVRIDADGDVRGLAEARRDGAQRQQFGLGFDVEGENAGIERKGHLGARLADAGEDDAVRRHARGQRAAQFAFGDDVHAGAEIAQRLDDGLVGIGLDGVADEASMPRMASAKTL